MKILLVCSAGGHLTEMERLLPAFAGHRVALVTYHGPRGHRPLPGVRTYQVENIETSVFKLIKALPTFVRAFAQERPDVVVSTGSEIAVPALYMARCLGIRTLYVESWCRVRTPSGTGRLVYPVVDRFLVQWESLLERYGSKAEYRGRVF